MKLKLACLLIGAGVIPLFCFNLFLGLQLMFGALVHGQRPARLDNNLFLRAREGLLPSTRKPLGPEEPWRKVVQAAAPRLPFVIGVG